MSDALGEFVLEAPLSTTTRPSPFELDWEEITQTTDDACQGLAVSEHHALIRALRLRPINVPNVYFDRASAVGYSTVETGSTGLLPAIQEIPHHGTAPFLHLHGGLGPIVHVPGGYYVSEQS